MTRLNVQLYNIDAGGFLFDSRTEFAAKSVNYRDRFIDGGRLGAELASALPLNQGKPSLFFTWLRGGNIIKTVSSFPMMNANVRRHAVAC